ncbi:MAG TPA: imidazole glycerol phosphate synthase subunit HisF [Marinobacter sp.]|uniref:imidazole glycerol-phosphate synthase n=1 Tax=marine sediment metagenome TaxID=412755 RepID=A0A0F9LLC7_9ZZZZ|nr:imidazole glycerol phosphate synthase subunit HisF [Marinobacter sp.]
MSLAFRLIARLDIRGAHLIKTIRLEGVRKLGDPADYAKRYDAQGIDEIIYNDAVASLYGRNGLGGLLQRTADECFVPVTAAGGIRSVSDVRELLRVGADKIAVNTAAIKRPELITEIAEQFGSQAMVIQIDAKRKNGGWEAYCDGGRQPTGKDAIEWAAEAVGRGAGEVLVTSIDREGTASGCDSDLCRRISNAVPVPTVAAGGICTARHVIDAAQAGATGVAMAGALHYGKVSLAEMRGALTEAGIPVRTL